MATIVIPSPLNNSNAPFNVNLFVGGREGAALRVDDGHVGPGRALGEHRHRHGRRAREERPRVAGAGQIVGEDRERHRARPS